MEDIDYDCDIELHEYPFDLPTEHEEEVKARKCLLDTSSPQPKAAALRENSTLPQATSTTPRGVSPSAIPAITRSQEASMSMPRQPALATMQDVSTTHLGTG